MSSVFVIIKPVTNVSPTAINSPTCYGEEKMIKIK